MKRVLIIGGYGNFGGIISRALAKDENLSLIIAGRSLSKAQSFIRDLASANAPEAAELDITGDIAPAMAALKPDIVIHTCGPFQGQDYRVAEAAIAQGCHYIDLAD